MSVVMEEQQSQPVFRDFLGPGPGPNSEMKQPEMSATDSVRVSQTSGFMEEDGEASVRGGSTFSAPCPSGPPPGTNYPASSDPGAEPWRQPPKAGVPFPSKPPGMNDANRFLPNDRNMMNDGLVEGSRPVKVSRFKQRENDALPSTGTGDLGLSMQPPRVSQAGINGPWLQTSVFKTDPSTGTSKRLEASRPVGNGGVPLPVRSTQVGATSGGFTRNSVGTTTMQPPPADEGSRTGLQGGGISALINNPASKLPSSSGRIEPTNLERTATLDRSKLPLQAAGSDSLLPSHKPSTSVTRQLTIFYGGQAHVFDDVSPDKADAIMSLAGSNGRSWSTTYAHRSSRSETSLGDLDRRREKAVNGSASLGMSADMQNILQGLNQAGSQARKHGRFPADQIPKVPADLPPGAGARFGVAANGRPAPGLHGSFYNVKEAGSNGQHW